MFVVVSKAMAVIASPALAPTPARVRLKAPPEDALPVPRIVRGSP